ncbi:MAG TPA: GNAT family N-acetyltransferase [Polyangia bacterium]|nr:GNAT family N-acetyltransferase [Polyangia bacterium]
MNVTLRPITDEDEPFLRRVYASTREAELAPLGWPPAQQDAFLRMQFDAQRRHYAAAYDGAAFSIILRDGRPAGRLYVDRREREIRVVDIALLPEHRAAGIGGALLRQLFDEAARGRKTVSIHVERQNAARRLYQRLGFVEVEGAGDGVYALMEWRPEATR